MSFDQIYNQFGLWTDSMSDLIESAHSPLVNECGTYVIAIQECELQTNTNVKLPDGELIVSGSAPPKLVLESVT